MAKQNKTKQSKEKKEPIKLEIPEAASELGTRLATTPFALMKRFGEEMDRLFDDFGGRDWLNSIGREFGTGVWAPQVEMFVRDGELVVRADLPGLTKDDVNVEINDGGLTIEGERRGGKDEKREGFYRSERSYGKFHRRLPLPDGVNVTEANATFNNGVLEITMGAPRKPETKKRRVQIRDESQPRARSTVL